VYVWLSIAAVTEVSLQKWRAYCFDSCLPVCHSRITKTSVEPHSTLNSGVTSHRQPRQCRGGAQHLFELALEIQRWTRASSECLPGGGAKIIVTSHDATHDCCWAPAANINRQQVCGDCKQAACCCVWSTDQQTDRQTPSRYLDLALHTTLAESVMGVFYHACRTARL